MSATIIKDGVEYCSSSKIQKLTYAKYKELENKNLISNDTMYYITDVADINDASNIVYDDTNTLFGVENTQNAIENVNNNIEKCFDLFAFQGVQRDNVSIAKSATASLEFNVTKEGYTPIGAIIHYKGNASSSGANSSYIRTYGTWIDATNNIFGVHLRNSNSSSTAKIKVSYLIMYVKSEYYDLFAPVYNTVS